MLNTEIKVEVAQLRQAGMTFQSIGAKFGHGREWARQTAAKGMRELMKRKLNQCIKPGCDKNGVRQACGKRGEKVYLYCDMHYRVNKMRENARRDGKICPSEQDTLSMIRKIKDMKCPRCRKTMHLLCGNGVKLRDIATLQHNHDGTIEVCCHSCNSRHAHTKIGDGVWRLGDNEKFCPDCEIIKPTSEFHKNRSRFTGLQDVCKNCTSTRQKRYYRTGFTYEQTI